VRAADLHHQRQMAAGMRKEAAMRVSFSLLLLLTIVIVAMIVFRHKGDGLTLFEFLLCGTWGFLLASSTLAPTIRNFISSLTQAFSR
jgi:hypothetical protein